MYFFGFGAGENERETDYGRIAVQWYSNLSPLKGEMSRSDKGVHPSEQLRRPPPLSGEALQKGRCHGVTEGFTPPSSYAAHLPFLGRLCKRGDVTE